MQPCSTAVVPQPVQQPRPVARPEQHHRERGHLAGLHQGQGLEQLVQGAEAARHHHEALGVLHEHRLAGEEVAEVDAEVDVRVEAGLERQLDAQADRGAARLGRAPVGRLHHAGTAAGDHRQPGVDQPAAELPGRGVDRAVGLGPGRAEDADRRAQLGQGAEAVDELRLDPQHPPRVGVHPVGRAPAVQQPLVGRGAPGAGDRRAPPDLRSSAPEGPRRRGSPGHAQRRSPRKPRSSGPSQRSSASRQR